jgi:branched-chain amino acid transport system substrate-binding protein
VATRSAPAPGRPLRIRGGFACALLAILGAACGGDDRPVAIGVAAAEPFLFGARMALDEALAQGPVPGLDTLLLEEGSNLSAPAVENAGDLVVFPAIAAVVGHANSAASLAAAPIYHAHEIVQMAPTSTAVTYSDAGPYSFRMVPPDDRQGPFLARALTAEFPDSARLALFYVNDDYGSGLRDSFLAALPAGRYPTLLDLPHAEGEVPPQQIADGTAALLAADPDVVVWLARPTMLVHYLATIRQELPGVPIFGGDALSQIPTTPGAETLWRGIRYVDFIDPQSTEPLRDLSRRYRARHGHDPSGAAILTYEAVNLLIDGVRAGARTGPELRAWLNSLGRERPVWQGVAGPVSFDDQGNLDREYVLRTAGSDVVR